MNQPLLIYKNGTFVRAPETPDWYAEIEAALDIDDFNTALDKFGFQRADAISDENDQNHVVVHRRDDVFYATCWDTNGQLWHATFSWEEWPSFLSQFVLPWVMQESLWNLRYEFDEYLARNDPNSSKARERRDEAKRMAERRAAQQHAKT